MDVDLLARKYRELYELNGHLLTPYTKKFYCKDIYFIHNGQKLTSLPWDFSHEKLADNKCIDYWAKHRFTDETIQEIDWTIVGKSMNALPHSRHHWFTKQATGYCGVGQTLYKWKYQSNDICPKCNTQTETPIHMLKCQAGDADECWAINMKKIDTWLAHNETDPDLSKFLMHCIKND